MAEMVDLKQSVKQMKEAYASPATADYYPLTLHLSKDQVEKLGLGSCKVGDDYTMTASVHVVSMSKSEHEHGGGHNSLSLEIRKAAIDTGKKKSAGETLYGKK